METCATTACQHLIPPVLCEFKESFPEHAVAIEPGDTSQILAALLNRRIDLGLSLEPQKEPQVEFHPLFIDELDFIVSPLHPWAQAGRIERSEIPRQNYILYNKQSVTFRVIEEYFRREHIVLNAIIELGSMEAIKELVKLGLGVSILARWIARADIKAGWLTALPLGRRKLQRRWGILHWRGKRLNLAEETFLGLCKGACAELNGPSVETQPEPEAQIST